jgi:DNA-binding transcriptional MocR family regulator
MEEKKKPVQFTTLPNGLSKNENIKLVDILVYLMCKKHMNKDTRIAFPSQIRLSKECEIDKNTVVKALKNLEKNGYIQIIPQGLRKPNHYKFPIEKEKEFELISFDLLMNEKLTAKNKAYLATIQQYFYIDKDSRTGQMCISDYEVARDIKSSTKTIQRYDAELISLNCMQVGKSSIRDQITGLLKKNKSVNLDVTGQAVVLLAENQDQIVSALYHIVKQLNYLNKQNDRINERLDRLEQNRLQNSFEFN